jgi:hypothetical protein
VVREEHGLCSERRSIEPPNYCQYTSFTHAWTEEPIAQQ